MNFCISLIYPDSANDDPNHTGSKSKTKRVRTTFTDEQLQILQANFLIDSNPDGQVSEEFETHNLRFFLITHIQVKIIIITSFFYLYFLRIWRG